MADTKPGAKICDPNESEHHKEISPQKLHKDKHKETTPDNSLTSTIQNSASEEPQKVFSYIMNEKQDDSETETSWNTVLDVKVKGDDKSCENSNNEESTKIDLATADCRKDSTIPLKFDELPPEPDWTTISNVTVKSEKDAYIMADTKPNTKNYDPHKGEYDKEMSPQKIHKEESTKTDLATANCRKDSTIPLKFDELPPEPDWTTISNVTMKSEKDAYIMADTEPNTKNYDPHKGEYHKEMSPKKIHREESTKTDLATAYWSKVNTIPLQFDELPPEPDWTTVSNVVVKGAKDDSISDKTYEHKGFLKEHVNRRHSYSKNEYSRVPQCAKLSVTRASRDELRHANLNSKGHRFEDLEQDIYRYRDEEDLKYVQHDQNYLYRRNFKPHTSAQESSTLYRPRDPSPDYD
ncbi:uncharacterized protein [Macrobrachium rosenbergii]|uniref:uncharacterized protein n=1 Tax=Macrobrachium rosenbergii TaxID=79674 RepID=UPI0034D3BA5A